MTESNDSRVPQGQAEVTPSENTLPPEFQGAGLVAKGSTRSGPEDTGLLAECQALTASGSDDLATFSTETHSYIREYIALADQKAFFTFGVAVGVLAFMEGSGGLSRWQAAPWDWSVVDWAAFLVSAFIAFGGVRAVLVVLPRTPGDPKGVVFWKAIANQPSADAYAKEVRGMTGTQLVHARLLHCHELATVCARKYRLVDSAMWMVGIGLALLGLYVVAR
jgi:hypothetical protein